MSTLNGRVLFKEPPTTIIVPGQHLVHENTTIDLDSVPLNGGVLAKTRVLSPDPYMRGKLRQRDAKSPYGFDLGKPIWGFGLAEVIRSENPAFKAGDIVESGSINWEHYSLYSPDSIKILKPAEDIPLSAYVGTLGMAGMTAYLGLTKLGEMNKGDTLFVTGAAGAIGTLLIQLAKLNGLKVVGSVGSDEKVEYIKNELGADVAFNYKKESTAQVLAKHPFDIYFDNVNGETLDIALASGKPGARFLLCGAISNYTREGGPYGIKNTPEIFRREYKVFGVNEYRLAQRHGTTEAVDTLVKLIRSGDIKLKEHVTNGLENGAAAFAELLTGGNTGKAVIVVSD